MSTETIEAVIRSIDVSIEPDRAFELFTRRMGEWWPMQSYSIAAEKAVGVRFEEWVGARYLRS